MMRRTLNGLSVSLALIALPFSARALAVDAPAPAEPAVPARSLPVPNTSPKTAPQALNVLDILSLRDPFKRIVTQVNQGPPKGPLERYPTGAFKMIGVVTGPDHYKAVLLDPEGQTHIVNRSMKIGQNGGKITNISADQVVVRERVANIFGQIEEVSTSLELIPESKRDQKNADAYVKESSQILSGIPANAKAPGSEWSDQGPLTPSGVVFPGATQPAMQPVSAGQGAPAASPPQLSGAQHLAPTGAIAPPNGAKQ